MTKEDIFLQEFEKLNKKQKEVVDSIYGPVMVVAGPGTGKTQVLGLRVANILKKDKNISPNNILCLTFTDAGAINMRERLARFIGSDAYRVGIYTFHSFCNSVITRYPEYFYNAASFSTADDIARSEIVDEIFSNLSHNHPLSSFHPNEGYIYKSDVVSRIKNIKSAGFTPEEYSETIEKYIKEIPEINKILEKWPLRLSSKNLNDVISILNNLYSLNTDYGKFLAKTLSVALSEAGEIEKTEPIGDWRDKYTEKGDDSRVLKDTNRIDKIRAVSEIYTKYESILHERALYDYDDMIIDVRRAIEENSVLRNSLEEQYQFILVDEFQDTNEAQLRLVIELSSNPIHEGKPNVMVVGDDDQAIFKFQGAEISNIIRFKDLYLDVKNIVLDTNYRSHKNILDVSRQVVVQGNYRLEKELKISKELTQGNKNIDKGEIIFKEYDTEIEEYGDISKKIKKLIDEGEDPEEIAVIANKHSQLQDFITFLDFEGVPYSYIRRASVFDEPHVSELICVCEYISSVNSDQNIKNDLLPKILSFKYFNIERIELFKIALAAKIQNKSWSEVLADYKDSNVRKAFSLLIELSGDSEIKPLEHILDEYMNLSGFKDYYFGKNTLEERPSQYVSFLASLKTFIEALRGWRDGEIIFVKDVTPFVALHKNQGIDLISTSPFIKGRKSVQVMTAHKSKGLEFGNVFIIGAHEKIWAKRGRVNKAPVPAPVSPLVTPAGEDEDDFIRILYVSLTRAKHSLSITGHDRLVKYLNYEDSRETKGDPKDIKEAVTFHERFLSLDKAPIIEDERAVLLDVLKDYRLSVTHLNNFIDIESGGPEFFLEQNLLRFPQPMQVAAVFGSAIDSALTEMVRFPRYNAGDDIGIEKLISVFKRELAKGRLPLAESKKQIKKGEDLLSEYLRIKKGYYNFEDEAQVDFKNEGVVIEGAPITGKIDFLRNTRDGYLVVDFKTGKVAKGFDEQKLESYEKIKLYKYKKQLMFYQLLISNSSRKQIPICSLELEFVEGALLEEIPRISYPPTEEELSRLSVLIGIVYQKIMNLDFPDTSKYPKTLEGIIEFENDLINRVI